MEEMTKHQLVLLVLLVSFVTALVTGIVTVALVTQTNIPVTQTIQRVVERTISGPSQPQPLLQDEAKQLEIASLARDVLIEDISSRVSPAVVSIIASKDIPVIEQSGIQKQQVSTGSGFFISQDGYVLTNKHVVEDTTADYTVITNDEKKLPAKIIARDPLNDMALLKVTGSGYSFIPLGNSDEVKIGQSSIAIGNALGQFQNTVSVGVISGLRRSITAIGSALGPEELSSVIQTDAAINPGNSGGPLLNLKGEVIGLNTAIAEGAQSIGFAIPINQIKKGVNQAKTNGKIIYPYLGVRYILVTPDVKDKYKLTTDYGAYVMKGANGETAVIIDSPANKAGVVDGDVILAINGSKIDKDNSLSKLIQQFNVGDKVTVKILRDAKEIDMQITLEARKDL